MQATHRGTIDIFESNWDILLYFWGVMSPVEIPSFLEGNVPSEQQNSYSCKDNDKACLVQWN